MVVTRRNGTDSYERLKERLLENHVGVAMSNQRSFKIGSFRFAAFVPKKIECKRF
jgi:hypothetical protein